MKLNRFKLAALAVGCLLAQLPAANAVVVVGSGPDISHLVIEAPDFGNPLEYEYHYTYNASSPLDTYSMLAAIDGAQSNLSFDLINFGSAGSPNYYLDAVTFNSITVANTNSPFWAQWVSGGGSGYPTASPIASGTWIEGSGISSPYRTLAPGSWDGFIYNGDYNPNPPYNLTSAPPSIAPVPEPATMTLFILSGLGIVLNRRRHA